MSHAVIIAARRTAIAPQGGALRACRVEDLAAPVMRAVLADAGLPPDAVDEVILANVLGEGGNPARRAALAAGLPDRVAGLTIDRQCAGGLDAILLAQAMVLSGQARLVLAGGAESHSRRPARIAHGQSLPYDQAPFTPWPDRDPQMAVAAAALARDHALSPEAQRDWAVASHARACAAKDEVSREIVPLAGLDHDPFARIIPPALANRARALPATPPDAGITALTTAVAADGAAFVLVGRQDLVGGGRFSLRILAGRTLGAVPWQPGLAPIPAIAAALHAARLTPAHLTHAEVMEAYAAQAMACVTGAGLAPDIVNRRGGALARGHAIGASGAVLAVRLFSDLRVGGGLGLATIAAAGGIGTALVVAG